MRKWLVALLLGVTVACGTDEPAVTTAEPDPTTTSPAPTTTLSPATTTSRESTTSATIRQVDVRFTGEDIIGPDVFEVAVGETVDIWVHSDVDDEIHVHGYDLFFDLEAGVPFHLTFVADIPGVFEVEAHTRHTKLFDLEVSG